MCGCKRQKTGEALHASLSHQARERRASPWPWKKRNERPKSATKMRTREMTTADVVDSPTPLAPPVVVKPHEQLT